MTCTYSAQGGFLERMFLTLWLLALFETAIPNQTRVMIINKGRKGLSTAALVRKTLLSPGSYSRPFHVRTTRVLMRLGWKSQRLSRHPCPDVRYWSSVVSPLMPTASVSRRSLPAVLPRPWRTMCTRRPIVILRQPRRHHGKQPSNTSALPDFASLLPVSVPSPTSPCECPSRYRGQWARNQALRLSLSFREHFQAFSNRRARSICPGKIRSKDHHRARWISRARAQRLPGLSWAQVLS
jgi:hypothetical protein